MIQKKRERIHLRSKSILWTTSKTPNGDHIYCFLCVCVSGLCKTEINQELNNEMKNQIGERETNVEKPQKNTNIFH